MNYMGQVAKMLDVELDEEFKVRECDYIYKLTTGGLIFKQEGTWFEDADMLEDMLKGKEEIKKIPWEPNEEEEYFYIDLDKEVDKELWYSSYAKDVFNYKIGNCFRTDEEITPEIIKKYTDFFNDDERMIKI